ncbi:sortase [Candidatus Daviesbacteria bacterium]|nr:sortase [Candidatus Daviesbacteria bacterium]
MFQGKNILSAFGEILRKQYGLPEARQGFGAILAGPKEQILIPKDTEFSILIPKIGASARVFPNVDSSSQDEFLPILQKGIAHAKGTVFPGMKGNIYLFAHSADNFWNIGRYNAVFYLLKDLVKGDSVVVFFQNRRYNYKVEELKIVDASDVSYLVESQKQDQQTLILQTCWPPGTTWKRLVVLARPK